jgi:hypothetical protein
MIARLGTQNASADAEAMKEAYRNDIVRARLHCKARPNFRYLEVHYKQTIDDPTGDRACRQRLPRRQARRGRRCVQAVQSELYRNRRG